MAQNKADTDARVHRKFDCHMHTHLCGHAVGEPVDYVDAAAEQGLSLITFTCHIPMQEARFAQAGIRMSHDELPEYRQMVGEAKEHGKARGVDVLYGIEAEIHPDGAAMEAMEQTIASENFDFVLGSLHHQLPAFRHWLQSTGRSSDAEVIEGYFNCLGEAARSGRYHSLSHPDVIRIYGTLRGRFDPVQHEGPIKDCLDAVAASDTCLEINTSGLIKGDFVVHPDPQIVEWALERNIPFTIGSDSHMPESVGQHFDEVIAAFKDVGMERLHYFRGGQRIAVEI